MLEFTAAQPFSFAPGEVLAERFIVERCLGYGSMSVVYLCRQISNQQRYAIKVLQPLGSHGESEAAFHTRFRIGVRIAQQVEHPRVARVLEYIDRPNLVACVMEYVEGKDLAAKLREEGRLAVSEALRILQQMAEGVQAIHECGVIHRDLKPGNILLSSGHDVKITDFGIARSDRSPKLTAKGGIVGTLAYVCPEGLQGELLDERSDIYALGVIGYEIITGKLPHMGSSVFAVVEKKIHHDPVPLTSLNPHCPARLNEIVLKAMNRDPVRRYRYALHLLEDLRELSEELAVDPNFAPTRPIELVTTARGGGSGSAAKRSPSTRLVGPLLVALLLFLVALWAKSPEAPMQAQEEIERHVLSASARPDLLEQDASLSHPILDDRPARLPSARRHERQMTLYRFANSVQWPPTTFRDLESPLRVCLMGNHGFGIDFDRILNHSTTSEGRKFWLQRLAGQPSVSTLSACHVLYAAGMTSEQFNATIDALRTAPILIVTDGSGLGIIDFDPTSSSGFTLYERRARDAGIMLNPVLRDLAARIIEDSA